MKRVGIGLVVMITAACGGGGGGSFEADLDPEVVTNLPAGDGTGTAATGDYDLVSVTTGCAGDCLLGGSDMDPGFPVCDVGTELTQTAHVEQDGGLLDIDVDGSDYVSQLAGGINADGSFEVGGYVTQNAGEVELTSREVGTFGGASLSGTGRLQIIGGDLDCLIEVDLEGTRQSPI
jgi:hypothetical protein